MGRPLTWEQATSLESVWCECQKDSSMCGWYHTIYPYLGVKEIIAIYKHGWFNTYGLENHLIFKEDYNIYFRCWNHYPTEEERNAAEWKK